MSQSFVRIKRDHISMVQEDLHKVQHSKQHTLSVRALEETFEGGEELRTKSPSLRQILSTSNTASTRHAYNTSSSSFFKVPVSQTDPVYQQHSLHQTRPQHVIILLLHRLPPTLFMIRWQYSTMRSVNALLKEFLTGGTV